MTRFSTSRRVTIVVLVTVMTLPAGCLWALPGENLEDESSFFQRWYQQLVELADRVQSTWGADEGGGFDPFGLSTAARDAEDEDATSNYELGGAEEE